MAKRIVMRLPKRAHASIQDKLDYYTDKSGGPDACWPWLAARDQEGYGFVWWEGRSHRPSRLICLLRGDRLTRKMVAMHHCDNPVCVNPAHIEAATHSKNQLDAFNKGRQIPKAGVDCNFWQSGHLIAGEKHTSAKLTWATVRYIRRMKGKISQTKLGERFGVSQSAISLVILGKNWPEKYEP